ncbi:exodeoxyribonuclease VII large subunit [Mariniblastus fucicola]|uniref:Exodeoxyribonuclease 7 large subunit n=1 Tax=Mariniblastus fucicola TaxID=980251 RepID=A0A5B9PBA7_9BACT|nr:exodeoxyribonuclease VII large subunit [Mariniblastus fucicola]QEG23574.1 Exodeoxyribonuclease 7 large subunit [Mariniblastus fucicola]
MKPVSVSVLTDAIRHTLNQKFGRVFVAAEISGITRPQSGHIYLTLKDEFAQISGVVWRTTAEQLKFDLEDGQKVVCGGYVDLYPQRGTYQLIIQQVQPVGIGELELAFRQLHAKLKNEGLFSPEHKKTLPRYPRRVALVTSPTGAAIRDFLQVLHRRWKNIEVTVLPVKVQGPGSANQIAAAIRSISRMAESPDVVVVTRGGGSKEDLWSFNEESVCRAVFDCPVPVISAVGHEVDVALSDLVADVRALTPSEAAERLVPDQAEFLKQLDNVRTRMTRALRDRLESATTELEQIAARPVFSRPMVLVERNAQLVDELQRRMNLAMKRQTEIASSEVGSLAGRLDSINPLAVLSRGYSLTSKVDGESRTLVGDSGMLTEGDEIETRLAQGTVTSKVVKTNR